MVYRAQLGAFTHPAAFLCGIAVILLLVVYGTRSDHDELNPFIGELLPAGHCLCHSSATMECSSCLDQANTSTCSSTLSDLGVSWEYRYEQDGSNEALSPHQCNAAFPGLFEDIHRAVNLRRSNFVKAEELTSMKMHKGMVRAMIYDGEVSGYGGVPGKKNPLMRV